MCACEGGWTVGCAERARPSDVASWVSTIYVVCIFARLYALYFPEGVFSIVASQEKRREQG